MTLDAVTALSKATSTVLTEANPMSTVLNSDSKQNGILLAVVKTALQLIFNIFE